MPKELLYLSAKKKILAYIKEQGLSSGDQLPSEHSLLKIFGVGRNTLRKALSLLIHDRIIKTVRGSGIFLTEVPVFKKQFTNRLQSFTAQMNEQDITVSYTVLEFSQVRRPVFLDEFFPNEKDFYYILRLRADGKESVFVYEKSWIPVSLFPSARAEDFSDSKLRYIAQHSKKIKNLHETYEPILSSSIFEDIFGIPKRSPMMKSSGILSAESGIALEYNEVYYNPKLYRFVSVGEWAD